MKRIILLSLVSLVVVFASCSRRTVSRIDPVETVDLSGRWNDTDSRLVAQEMVNDVLNRPWLERFEEKHDRQPVVIVGTILNRSHEHIDAETFIKNIEREFINTGLVRVVQGDEFREQMRRERADQQEFASKETISRWKQELGADYMLFGNINSIVDQYGRDKVIYYQVNLELADMETNEKVWIGEKQIKKAIRN